MLSLTKERHRLYRAEPESARIQEITDMLKPMRKEIRMCVKIEQHSLEIEQRLRSSNWNRKNKMPAGILKKSIRNRGGESDELWWRCGRPDRPVFTGRD